MEIKGLLVPRNDDSGTGYEKEIKSVLKGYGKSEVVRNGFTLDIKNIRSVPQLINDFKSCKTIGLNLLVNGRQVELDKYFK